MGAPTIPPPPPPTPPLPLAQSIFIIIFFTPIFYMGPPPIPPPPALPHIVFFFFFFFLAAILDFTDVKNVMEGRGGKGREGKEGTRLGFLCGLHFLTFKFVFLVCNNNLFLTGDKNNHHTQIFRLLYTCWYFSAVQITKTRGLSIYLRQISSLASLVRIFFSNQPCIL